MAMCEYTYGCAGSDVFQIIMLHWYIHWGLRIMQLPMVLDTEAIASDRKLPALTKLQPEAVKAPWVALLCDQGRRDDSFHRRNIPSSRSRPGSWTTPKYPPSNGSQLQSNPFITHTPSGACQKYAIQSSVSCWRDSANRRNDRQEFVTISSSGFWEVVMCSGRAGL
jgi:hypothetical protein